VFERFYHQGEGTGWACRFVGENLRAPTGHRDQPAPGASSVVVVQGTAFPPDQSLKAGHGSGASRRASLITSARGGAPNIAAVFAAEMRRAFIASDSWRWPLPAPRWHQPARFMQRQFFLKLHRRHLPRDCLKPVDKSVGFGSMFTCPRPAQRTRRGSAKAILSTAIPWKYGSTDWSAETEFAHARAILANRAQG